MNSGYVAILIGLSLSVLVLCGWRRELIGSLPVRTVLVFILAVLFTSGFALSVGSRFSFQLNEILYLGAALAAAYRADTPKQRTAVMFGGILLAIWCCLLAYIHRWSPISVMGPSLDMEIGAALIAAAILRSPIQQFGAVWMATTFGDIAEQALLNAPSIHLGMPSSQDVLWLTFLLTRVVSLLYEWFAQGYNRVFVRNK